MTDNFTPLNIEKIKHKDNVLNTILLLILTLTMAILALVLFIVIQRKINEKKVTLIESAPTVTPTVEFQSEEMLTPTLLPTIFEQESLTINEASETPILSITPATTSSEINN